MKPKTKKLIDNFETVVASRWPTVQDIRTPRWSRALLKILSWWRYALRVYSFPFELEFANDFVDLPAEAGELIEQDLSLPVEVEVFDSWAEVYDTQPNPLLALEERVLGSMMPDVRGLDVLDAGCGTGRWLERLADRSPRSLIGVDISPAMLLLAGIKLSQKCSLRPGSCTALPVSDTSCDLVLSPSSSATGRSGSLRP